MPTTYTPGLSLNLPEIGASRDTWGALLNENFTTLDSFVAMAMPIGALLDHAGPQPPSGWLIADGRTVSRTTYSALFAVLGTYWGTGDGSTTFNLPNLNGRSGVGPGQVIDQNGTRLSFTFAASLGWLSNPITQSNLPNYQILTDVHGGHNHGGSVTAAGSHSHTTDAQGYHSHGGATAPGANHSHTGYTDAPGDHQHILPGTWESPNGNRQRNTSFSGGFGELDNPATSWAGNHTHNVQTYGSGNLQLGINADGSHAHNVYAVGDHGHGIYWDGDHQHWIWLNGGGQWLGLLQPIIVVTKIIYAGPQAAAAVAAMAAEAGPMTAAGATAEIEALRQQVAQLWSILASPRLLQAPSRGSH